MFTQKDIQLLEQPYFQVIRKTFDFYEIQSRNTRHCWIISKYPLPDPKPVRLYHKHTIKTAYYHNHACAFHVEHAIRIIKSHDDYLLHPENYQATKNMHLA